MVDEFGKTFKVTVLKYSKPLLIWINCRERSYGLSGNLD
jgi:hypothetical protein